MVDTQSDGEVLTHFDRIVALLIDEPTLRHRLANRTTNDFGKHPEELRAALARRDEAEMKYRRLGATIINASDPPETVTALVVAAADSSDPRTAG